MTVGSLTPGFAVMMKRTLVSLVLILRGIETGASPLCPEQIINAVVGEDVDLLCPLVLQSGAPSAAKWSKGDPNNEVTITGLHLDHAGDRDHSTTRFYEDQSRGILRLLSVQLSDSETYMCSVPGQKARCIIQLTVDQVIEAEEGDDVSLECQQDAEVSLEDSLVEWSKDNRTNLVHVYRHGRDYLNDQKEEFKGRTTLFHEGLSRGNVTLQLRSVRLSDSGRFRCYVKKLDLYRYIILKVVQKGQNNPTQDFSSTPLPVETTTEPNVPDGGRSHLLIIIPAVGFIICIGLLLLMKCGKKCWKELRGRRKQTAEMTTSGSETEKLNTLSDGNGDEDPNVMRDEQNINNPVRSSNSSEGGGEGRIDGCSRVISSAELCL
ncbi:uncharacterized protein LOC121913668 isoform X1 [Thunnus maccoyii]|uniref:uncharacterized protein LOC121913668 isoform X1 n=1 Tax=Thunnus maccoyii TaxID=8240 RepID=UPI001C4D7631|nr:uncharacterized protein LOC121913668 isoform X1 [Thunnus maccoyii]